jgi:hypothetical protein
MVLTICAFTNLFMVLLYENDSYFQEQCIGNLTTPPAADQMNSMIMQNSSANNPFTNVFKVFFKIWLFIYGAWNPEVNRKAGDNILDYNLIYAIHVFYSSHIFENDYVSNMYPFDFISITIPPFSFVTYFIVVLVCLMSLKL